MAAMTVPRQTELKQQEREIWATGDYATIAHTMFWPAGAQIVQRVGVRSGDLVLDVACGTGNAAIRAAEAGGHVTGVDLTPQLFEAGHALAADAGVEIEWVEGDAEALPFPDDSFDVVLSTFGCMFAPRHQLAARELARVLRPGGRLGICSWTPDSSIAEMMRILMSVLPQPPEAAQPPALWGVEEHVYALFAGSSILLECEREHLEFRHESVDDALQVYETIWGPFMTARQMLQAEGGWRTVRHALTAVLERHNTATDGTLAYPGEYLTVLGRQRGQS